MRVCVCELSQKGYTAHHESWEVARALTCVLRGELDQRALRADQQICDAEQRRALARHIIDCQQFVSLFERAVEEGRPGRS